MGGFYLNSIGVSNWALGRSEAIGAIFKLHDCGIPILGGDVYVLTDGRIEQTYDSWHCDRLADEPETDYVKRSVEKALDYIDRYTLDSALFALVPNIEKAS